MRIPLWIGFLMLQIVTNIGVLNIFIALIGDSFDKVQNDRKSYDALQKVRLLEELNDLYLVVFGEQEDEYVKLHVISYSSSFENENSGW